MEHYKKIPKELQDPDKLQEAFDIISETNDLREVAKAFDKTTSCIHRWKKEFFDFAQLIERARDEYRERQCPRLERTLIERACGYEYDEVQRVYKINKDTRQLEEIKRFEHHKRMPPETSALIYLLNNLMPEKYRSKIEASTTNTERIEVAGSLNVAELPDEALQEIADKLQGITRRKRAEVAEVAEVEAIEEARALELPKELDAII